MRTRVNEIKIEDSVTIAAQKLNEEHILALKQEVLPWRDVRTPYRIFLAEFLLVRTRSDVVASIFEEIISQFPDLISLAGTNEQTLFLALERLGLKKRIPLLLRAAKYLVENHAAQIPQTVEDLLQVPGLGLYTAVAIVAFAYNSPEVPADVNILRFLSRLTGLPMIHPTKGSKQLHHLLPLLSQNNNGPKTEKLLDFSRLICCARQPRCQVCPLKSQCAYFLSERQKTADL